MHFDDKASNIILLFYSIGIRKHYLEGLPIKAEPLAKPSLDSDLSLLFIPLSINLDKLSLSTKHAF